MQQRLQPPPQPHREQVRVSVADQSTVWKKRTEVAQTTDVPPTSGSTTASTATENVACLWSSLAAALIKSTIGSTRKSRNALAKRQMVKKCRDPGRARDRCARTSPRCGSINVSWQAVQPPGARLWRDNEVTSCVARPTAGRRHLILGE